MLSEYYTIEALENSPKSIRKISNQHDSIVAYIIPREEISKSRKYTDLNSKPAVYILYNTENHQKIYIGESDHSAQGRLDQHNKKKEFWNMAIVFVTKTNDMLGSQSKYLESKLLEIASELEIETDNVNDSYSSDLPKNVEYSANRWKQQIVEIAQYINLNFFSHQTEEYSQLQEKASNRKPKNYTIFEKKYEFESWVQLGRDICDRAIDVLGYDIVREKIQRDERLTKLRFVFSHDDFRKLNSVKDNESLYYRLGDNLYLYELGNKENWINDGTYLYKLLSGEELILNYSNE